MAEKYCSKINDFTRIRIIAYSHVLRGESFRFVTSKDNIVVDKFCIFVNGVFIICGML